VVNHLLLSLRDLFLYQVTPRGASRQFQNPPLAYRLYTLCERRNWAEDARAYNEVVTSWSGIESAAAQEPTTPQRTLFE
jgi:adenine-specific DNA methylase